MSFSLLKFECIVFYLFLLFLPTQLGKHFIFPFSVVAGIRIDYLFPTLYFTDLIIILLACCRIAANFRKKVRPRSLVSRYRLQLIIGSLVMALLIAGIVLAKNPAIGWYNLLKVFELMFLGLYTAWFFGKNKVWKYVPVILSCGMLVEGLLVILQFIHHGSLGGAWYFLGERAINSSTPGVANANINGQLVLRPYGTFSHPNVLAGYMVVICLLLLGSIKSYAVGVKRLVLLSSIMGIFILVLSLSRWALIVFVLCLFTRLFFIKTLRFGLLLGILLLLSVMALDPYLQFRFLALLLPDEGIAQRVTLIQVSLAMALSSPVFGVGLGNFLPNIPSFLKTGITAQLLQPVHAVYLLLFAETGILGLGSFVLLLFFALKNVLSNKSYTHTFSRISVLSSVSACLLLGLTDHYLLTIQQGQLLLAFVVGLCFSFPLESLPRKNKRRVTY